MGKIVILLFIIAVIFDFNTVYSASNDIVYFRETKWGMNKKEVAKVEKARLKAGENSINELVYEDVVAGLPVVVTYHFYEGKLYKGVYSFKYKPSERSVEGEIENHKMINKIIKAKYGEPIDDEFGYFNEEAKSKTVYNTVRGIVFGCGVMWLTRWDFKDVSIGNVFIKTENCEIIHSLGYYVRSIYEKVEKAADEKRSKDF